MWGRRIIIIPVPVLLMVFLRGWAGMGMLASLRRRSRRVAWGMHGGHREAQGKGVEMDLAGLQIRT
jgi:hypothetical protein